MKGQAVRSTSQRSTADVLVRSSEENSHVGPRPLTSVPRSPAAVALDGRFNWRVSEVRMPWTAHSTPVSMSTARRRSRSIWRDSTSTAPLPWRSRPTGIVVVGEASGSANMSTSPSRDSTRTARSTRPSTTTASGRFLSTSAAITTTSLPAWRSRPTVRSSSSAPPGAVPAMTRLRRRAYQHGRLARHDLRRRQADDFFQPRRRRRRLCERRGDPVEWQDRRRRDRPDH